WHDNWLSNKDAVIAAYGERWFRIWHFFLAWSTIIAEQGNAACFQVVLNKNLDSFDRGRWIRRNAAELARARAPEAHAPAPLAAVGTDVPAPARTNGNGSRDQSGLLD